MIEFTNHRTIRFIILIGIILVIGIHLYTHICHKNVATNVSVSEYTDKEIPDMKTKKTKNKCSVNIISSTESEQAKLSDNSELYTILINDIPNFERIYGCSTLIEYYSKQNNIILNYCLHEGMKPENISEHTIKYLNDKNYGNHILKKEELNLTDKDKNIHYSGMRITYINNNETYTQIFLNRKLNDNITLSVEIIEMDGDKKEKNPENYLNYVSPDIIEMVDSSEDS